MGYDCLLVYPIQRQHQADSIFKNELHDCYEHELGKGSEFRDCLAYAQLKSGADMWSLKAFYIRESWFLAFVVVAIPLLAYGFCRGITAMSLWVWRGFRGEPVSERRKPMRKMKCAQNAVLQAAGVPMGLAVARS